MEETTQKGEQKDQSKRENNKCRKPSKQKEKREWSEHSTPPVIQLSRRPKEKWQRQEFQCLMSNLLLTFLHEEADRWQDGKSSNNFIINSKEMR